MEGTYHLIKTRQEAERCGQFISEIDLDTPQFVQIVPWDKNRTLRQNQLTWLWCREVSKQGGEYTPEQVHNRFKFHYAVPILRAEDQRFAAFWDSVEHQPYEVLVDSILPLVAVTRRMKMKQLSQAMSDFQAVFSRKYQLTDPGLYGLSETYL